ncbi:MAG: efflux transporter periplasmic adaptor subunit [Deltaproteobacteria bacterium]|nr:MAG: efflux transporter periplasmic adaptor subunit [Deltaproteobacteria bacterium]
MLAYYKRTPKLNVIILFFLMLTTPSFADPSPPAPLVGFIAVQAQDLTLTDNLPGRLESSRDAVVRARVTGIVEKRLFREGAFVREGDVLFTIDNRPFKAALQSAKGTLAKVIAQKKLNEANVLRYRKLIDKKAVSQQVLDQAEATLASTIAEIEIAKASVIKAEIDLDYTTVTAPISGFIGQQEVTEGALVSASSATQMAQIRQIDPLYVNVQQSAANILNLKAMMQQQKRVHQSPEMAVKIFLDDGTPYQYPGKLIFTDVAVNAATGEAMVRASVPNPDKFLMPGLYVRVEMPLITLDDIFLIPQKAITRTDKGDILFVLNDDNTFTPRPVQIARSWKNNWIVTGGLQAGDKVIIDGMLKVHIMHAQKVTPVPLADLRNQATEKAAGTSQQPMKSETPAAGVK